MTKRSSVGLLRGHLHEFLVSLVILCGIFRIVTRSQIVPKHTDLRWVGTREKLALLTNSTS
jgi:hypothetical protein